MCNDGCENFPDCKRTGRTVLVSDDYGGLINRFWLKRKKQIVGVAIDFEFAEDVHFELSLGEWKKFEMAVFKKTDVPTAELSEYFDQCRKDDLAFLHDLQKHGIRYNMVAFDHFGEF